jgi:Uma2 family endonuclease
VVPLVNGKRIRVESELKDFPLVVEVLSPSTARWDRVKKRRLYREERIPEYWIADLDARVIERATSSSETIEVESERLVWAPEGRGVSLTIDVERYFADVLDD